ncbi:zinc-binding dehydrogenase [Mycolicibacterium sp. 018/SC-01/001]|uniref:alcohol dehydrogenase catalytic domain-containing protein n=1 Tax=Mycolicibacterium sp. 018/SC-01/001 TaxID=2592069 RepID=UPI00117E9CDE|nr:alcohol dehydrogenase catalytic domain-containing protein [Mycolicibacterium sp. 018/SC-01/001]TRW80321.1 zinc-binding dehydrogenase [Mycolicibacterium sp. 018/SC-01/001]
MRALVMDRIGGPLEVRTVADPRPPSDGVVVAVQATGLCRSDWHAWAGHEDLSLPHVPGHEFAGVIVAVGSQVRQHMVGDRVTVPFVCGCGACRWCRAGSAQVCPQQQQPGFTYWGSFAQYVAVPAADVNLVGIPESVSFAAAAGLGCRFATAYRALTGVGGLQRGHWLTVVGAGGVGLSAVMIGKALGANVIAVDRTAGALAAADALGADRTVVADGTATTTDIAAAIHEITGGGSDLGVDAVGHQSACELSILSLRRHGRHVQVGLLPPVDGHPRVPMDRVIAWEISVLGSHGMAAVDYPPMMAMIERGDLRPHDLIQRTITLEEAARALPAMDSASPAGITLIDPSA